MDDRSYNREEALAMKSPCCVWCGASEFEDLAMTDRKFWVSGDRKIFHANGIHFSRKICSNCGIIQFYSNQAYKNAVKSIFSVYGVMHNKVREGGTDVFLPRLEAICMRLKEKVNLPTYGRLLDIGCGGGEFFSRFHSLFPKWELYGMDIGSQFAEEVLSTQGIKRFFSSCDEVRQSKKCFDLITLNSVLSLADNPVELLSLTHDCLTDSGKGFIQETDYTVQPWVMFELEAMSLVSKETVTAILERNGFEVKKNVYEESNKELGYIFQKSKHNTLPERFLYEENKRIYERKIKYMNDVMETVKTEVKSQKSVGIFGTSLAGTWLVQVIRDVVGEDRQIFFVDEDEELLGKIVGYNVLHPKDVVEKAIVFFPFPKYVSNDIIHRMKAKQYLENCKLVVL